MISKKTKMNIIVSAMLGTFVTPNITPIVALAENSTPQTRETALKPSYHFAYTGTVQEFTAPYTGTYILEAWGAEGGDNATYGDTISNNGGYAKGYYDLEEGETIYIYVGGKGGDEMSNSGGWNGGGSGGTNASACGGGGATDFRTEKQDVNQSFTSGSSDDKRILVAGGGGGLPATYDENFEGSHEYGAYPVRGINAGNTPVIGGYYGANNTFTMKEDSTYQSNVSRSEILTLTNIGETDDTAYGGGGGGYEAGQSFTLNRKGGSYSSYKDGFTQGVGGTNSIRGVYSGVQLSGEDTMPHPAKGVEVGHSGDGYAKITPLNFAPELSLYATLRNGMTINPNDSIQITGSIKGNQGNTMSVYYSFDGGEPVQIYTGALNQTAQDFNGTFKVPSSIYEGEHSISIWAENDLGGITKKTEYKLFYIPDTGSAEAFLSSKITPSTLTNNPSVIIDLEVNPKMPIEYIITPDNRKQKASDISYEVTTNGNYLFKAITYEGEEYTKLIKIENIDATKPSMTINSSYSKINPGRRTLTATAEDTGSGIAEIILPDGSSVKDTNEVTYEALTAGEYTFTAIDKAGNSYSKTETLYDVVFDFTGALITVEKSTDDITKELTLTIKVNKACSLYLNDNMIDGYMSSSSSKKVTITKNGEYKIKTIDAYSGFVNEQTIVIDNIDDTAPTLTFNYNKDWSSKNVVIDVVGNDDLSGVASIKMPDSTTINDTYGQYTATENGRYIFEVTDKAGNKATQVVDIDNIDKSAPLNTTTLIPAGWTNQDVEINLNLLDAEAGIDKVICPDDSEETIDDESYTYKYKVSDNGYYKFKILDKLGHMNVVDVPVNNIDRVKPNLNVLDTTVSNTEVTLSAEVSDTASGLDKDKAVEFLSPNGEAFRPTIEDGKATVTLSRKNAEYNGLWTIRVTDNAGNTTETTKSVSDFDGEPPILTLTAVDIGDGQKMITATAEDTGSGVKYIKTPDSNTHNTASVTYTVTRNDVYVFEAEDNAGNKTTQSITIGDVVSNNTEIELTLNKEGWTNTDVVITAKVLNSSLPIKYIKLPNGSMINADTVTYLVKSNGIYTFEAEDSLGNIFKNAIAVSNIDKNAPTVEIINETEWTNESVEVTIQAEDR